MCSIVNNPRISASMQHLEPLRTVTIIPFQLPSVETDSNRIHLFAGNKVYETFAVLSYVQIQPLVFSPLCQDHRRNHLTICTACNCPACADQRSAINHTTRPHKHAKDIYVCAGLCKLQIATRTQYDLMRIEADLSPEIDNRQFWRCPTFQ
jgi:hypothetical protein